MPLDSAPLLMVLKNHVDTPGAKLLCINDLNLKRAYTPGTPIRGHIYCVRKLYTNGGHRGVLLVGIIGPKQSDGLEQGFYLSRFRWVHD